MLVPFKIRKESALNGEYMSNYWPICTARFDAVCTLFSREKAYPCSIVLLLLNYNTLAA